MTLVPWDYSVGPNPEQPWGPLAFPPIKSQPNPLEFLFGRKGQPRSPVATGDPQKLLVPSNGGSLLEKIGDFAAIAKFGQPIWGPQRAAKEKQQALQQAMSSFTEDPLSAAQQLAKLGMVDEARQLMDTTVDNQREQMGVDDKTRTVIGAMLGGVKDDTTYQAMLPRLQAYAKSRKYNYDFPTTYSSTVRDELYGGSIEPEKQERLAIDREEMERLGNYRQAQTQLGVARVRESAAKREEDTHHNRVSERQRDYSNQTGRISATKPSSKASGGPPGMPPRPGKKPGERSFWNGVPTHQWDGKKWNKL